jgi:hypothetical protein
MAGGNAKGLQGQSWPSVIYVIDKWWRFLAPQSSVRFRTDTQIATQKYASLSSGEELAACIVYRSNGPTPDAHGNSAKSESFQAILVRP